MAFVRQINFRITAEDHHLLESAAREHGSQQDGILAALRLLEQQRLDNARKPKPRGRPQPKPAPDDWWEPTSTVAELLGETAPALRGWAASGRAEVRGSGKDEEINLASLQVDRERAAQLLGITVRDLAAWTGDGRADPNDDGLFVVGELELPLADAISRFELTPAQGRKLKSRESPHGRVVRWLDALEALG